MVSNDAQQIADFMLRHFGMNEMQLIMAFLVMFVVSIGVFLLSVKEDIL